MLVWFPTGTPCPIHRILSVQTWTTTVPILAFQSARPPPKQLNSAESIGRPGFWGTGRRGRTGSSRKPFATLRGKPTPKPGPESKAGSRSVPKLIPMSIASTGPRQLSLTPSTASSLPSDFDGWRGKQKKRKKEEKIKKVIRGQSLGVVFCPHRSCTSQ